MRIYWSTYGPLSKTFGPFSRTDIAYCIADRIDIAFDGYLETDIKEHERNRRGWKCQIVGKKMNSVKQNLPVELSKFWGSSTAKATFKMYSSLGYVMHILAKSLHTWVVQYQTIQNHASKFVVKTSSQSNAFTKKLMTARWFTSTMLCESRIYGKQLLLLQTQMCLLIRFTFSHAGFMLI